MTRNDYLKYFELGTSTDGYSDDFEKLEKKLFGNWVPPDVERAFEVYKSKPDGAKLFADYMTIHRPKGKLISPKGGWDRKGNEKMNKKSNRLKEMVERLIKEEVAKVRLKEEVVSPIEKEIAYLTGARDVKVHDFIKDNNINDVLLLKDLKTKKISNLDVITAIAGKHGNKYFQKLIAKYTK